MTAIQCQCTKCQAELRFNVNGAQELVRVNCPRCRNSFDVRLPKKQPPPPVAPLANLTDQDLRPQPAAPYQPYPQPGRAPAATSASSPNSWGVPPNHSKTAKHNSANAVKIALLSLAMLFAVVLVIGLGFGLYLYRGSFPQVSSIAKRAMRLDTPESINQELTRLSSEIETMASQMAESDRQTMGVDKLESYRPQFDDLFLRACRLPTNPRTTEQMLKEMRQLLETARQLKEKTPAEVFNQPKRHFGSHSNVIDNPWQASMNYLVETSFLAHKTADVQVEYPHPLKDPNKSMTDWSEEDRRILAVYWLQSKFSRSLIQRCAEITQKDLVTDSDLQLIFEAFDLTAKEAAEIAAVPSPQAGKFLIEQPKGSMYELQAMIALNILKALKDRIEKTKTPKQQELAEVMKLGVQMAERLEEIKYARASPPPTAAAHNSWEAYRKRRAEAAEKELAAMLEKDRKIAAEKEQQRQALELAEQRRQEREAKRQADEEARAKRMAEAAANKPIGGNDSAGSGRPFRGPPGMRPGFPGNSAPGFSGPPPDFGGSPPSFEMPKMTANGLTVIVQNCNDQQFKLVSDEVRKNFTNHTINYSGGRLTIQIFNFEHAPQEIEAFLTTLKVQSLDSEKRIVQAVLK